MQGTDTPIIACLATASSDYLGTYFTNNILTGTFDFTTLTNCYTTTLDIDGVTLLRSVTEDFASITALVITFTALPVVTVTP